MKSKPAWITTGIITAGLLLGFMVLRMEKRASPGGHDGHEGAEAHGGDHGGDHGEEQEEEAGQGPHRGRLLRDGNLALELSIFETGVPPQFRAFLFEGMEGGGKGAEDPAKSRIADLAGTSLTVALHRLGGRIDTIAFSAQGAMLLGGRTVEEPHSFDVKVRLERNGKTHRWAYSQVEGRVEIEPESMRASGIEVESAGPAVMKSVLSVNGKIMPNEDRLAHIFARFPGVVREVRKHLGETVKKGETLAIVESNESLEAYAVVSRIEGTVIRKHVTAGETVGAEEELFAITDLNSVWADFSVYRHDFPRLRKGQKVIVDAGEGSGTVTSSLAYLSPIGAEHTQTMTARAALPNSGGQWPPGLFIKGRVILSEFRVPVAVRAEALQTLRDRDVVFVNVGDLYEARPLELGRRDGQWVEVVSGLSPGERYVTRNSYVVKADIGKAGAAHEH
jgi:membrane fusion protein, heavy metal efflux system